MTVLTIDFEASCLPRHGRSFPIEVGIADGVTARSWLIRPHRNWWGWDWTERAQALHGIERERLDREGLAADEVLRQLTEAVAGRRVVADSRIDQYWLDTLAAAAGWAPPFAIDHVSTLFEEMALSDADISRAVVAADAAWPTRHRAAADALWLSALIGEAQTALPAIAAE